jgi:hypothetical protein
MIRRVQRELPDARVLPSEKLSDDSRGRVSFEEASTTRVFAADSDRAIDGGHSKCG